MEFLVAMIVVILWKFDIKSVAIGWGLVLLMMCYIHVKDKYEKAKGMR